MLRAPTAPDPLGVVAALGSTVAAATGFILFKRWPPPVDMITFTSWTLVMGGVLLIPVAAVVEGAPPPLDRGAILGYLWLAVAGTGVAYVCWFKALQRMPAGPVALIGLLNPLTATLIGVAMMNEAFGTAQAIGTALVLVSVLLGQPAIERALRSRRWRRARALARTRHECVAHARGTT